MYETIVKKGEQVVEKIFHADVPYLKVSNIVGGIEYPEEAGGGSYYIDDEGKFYRCDLFDKMFKPAHRNNIIKDKDFKGDNPNKQLINEEA